MIKAILIDGDGASLQKTKYFSDIYADEYHVPLEKVRAFFKEKFHLCQIGSADLKQELIPYLKDWGWQQGVDQFLDYWFHTQTIPNQQLLDFIQTIRAQGVKCYLASDQEKYRAGYISNVLNFNNYFDGCFYSSDLGVTKSQKEFFEKVIERLSTDPKEILYWDDEDIEMAKEAGINANIYKTFDHFKEETNLLLKI